MQTLHLSSAAQESCVSCKPSTSGLPPLPSLWCPRIFSHCTQSTHPNLTCFPKNALFVCPWGDDVEFMCDWSGWGRVGRFLFQLPYFLLVFSQANVLTLFPFLATVSARSAALLSLLCLLSSVLSVQRCFWLLRLTGLCFYVVCPFRPTLCIAG